MEVLLQVALKSRATSTTRTYVRAVKKFFQWCNEKNVSLSLPFHPATIALYLHEISQNSISISSLNIASAAIKWFHTLLPDSTLNPLENEFCKTILSAAKRKVGRPVVKKKPVSAKIIREIIDTFASIQATLKQLRTATFCALGFAGFFRFDELRSIQPNQIQFREQHMEILLPKSKTDVYREGNVVYVASSSTKYCPVQLVLRYMSAASIDSTSSLLLFRQLTFHKKTNSYTLRTSGLSYTSFRKLFKDALRLLGYDRRIMDYTA